MAVGLLVTGAIGIVVGVVLWAKSGSHDDRSRATPSGQAFVLGTPRPASAPFVGLTETQLLVGSRCVRVAVADDLSERVRGLRGRRDLGRYGAMLFVFPAPIDVGFTMSTVPVPLEIGFYAADGSPVSRRHMKPCPHSEAECPVYRAAAAFAYALERPTGKALPRALSSC
jgi:uncharacterized membrane protein (UPF0127 family)